MLYADMLLTLFVRIVKNVLFTCVASSIARLRQATQYKIYCIPKFLYGPGGLRVTGLPIHVRIKLACHPLSSHVCPLQLFLDFYNVPNPCVYIYIFFSFFKSCCSFVYKP